MQISGLTIVRNALDNGYLIAEVIDSLVNVCDEVVVCDGYSTDGTAEYLQSRTDIRFYQDEWNLQSTLGLEFARITDLGISRCQGDYVCYLQADELVHDTDLAKLREIAATGTYNSVSCAFLHIRYDFDHKLGGRGLQAYDRAIRLIRRGYILSDQDAYSFRGHIEPIYHSDIIVYHLGYVFLRNICRKMINHADHFYVGSRNYARRRELAAELLAKIDAGETIDPLTVQPLLEPEYQLEQHGTAIPQRAERLRGVLAYHLPGTHQNPHG